MSSTLYIQHPHYDQHSVPANHPESPLRVLAIETRMRQTGLWLDIDHAFTQRGNKALFSSVHTPGYIDQLYQMTPAKGLIYADVDTTLSHDSLIAIEEAAGASLQAVDAVMGGQYTRAFCSVRPPGHHAEPRKTMGFCFINNIALAAEHALTAHGLNRVLIFDFDVHQGNGTIEAFQGRDDVLVISSFQHPFYPFSHWQSDFDNIVNLPIPAESNSIQYRKLVEEAVLKATANFKPELILLSAGFDGHKNDPLGGLNLETSDFYWLTQMVTDLARQYTQHRVVSILEGGYDLEGLADSAHIHIQGLLET